MSVGSVLKKVVLGVVIAGGLGFGSLYGVFRFQEWRASTKPGHAYGSLFLDTPVPGKFGLVLLDDPDVSQGGGKSGAYSFTIRLTAVDPETGLAGASKNYSNIDRCWAATVPLRLWCKWRGNSVALLDATTLEIITDVTTAAQTLGTPVSTPMVLMDGGMADKLSDGRFARVDPATGAVAVVDERTIKEGGYRPRGTECSTVDHAGHFAFSSGTRAALIARTADSDAEPPADAPRFLEPAFLKLPDPKLVLVLHRVELGKPQWQLSRIGDDGKVAWTTDIGECAEADLEDRLLVLTTKDPAARAVAMYIGTGGIAWTYGRE